MKELNNIESGNSRVSVKLRVYVASCARDLYDKKIGSKDKCEKKWNSLKNRERETIIETLPKFKMSIRQKKYQPYPLTYLNNDRWLDDLSGVKLPVKGRVDPDSQVFLGGGDSKHIFQ